MAGAAPSEATNSDYGRSVCLSAIQTRVERKQSVPEQPRELGTSGLGVSPMKGIGGKKLGRVDPARRPVILSGLQPEQEKAIDVFREIYGMLEDYAPAWYSEELHERAKRALRALARG